VPGVRRVAAHLLRLVHSDEHLSAGFSMSERRRGHRIPFVAPGMGTLRVTQDVEVSRLDSVHAAVVTVQPLPAGERVLLEIPGEGGAVSARLARTGKSRFTLKDGRLQREIQLSMIGNAVVPDASERGEEPTPFVAAVSRRMPVRLVEVSASGCLWDAPAPLEEGRVGYVEVRTAYHYHSEAVRIVRTFRPAGSQWPYRMAVEFLTLAPLSPESLRGVAAIVAARASSLHRS